MDSIDFTGSLPSQEVFDIIELLTEHVDIDTIDD